MTPDIYTPLYWINNESHLERELWESSEKEQTNK